MPITSSSLPLQTVRDPKLSLWQSSARTAAYAELKAANAPVTNHAIYNHRYVQAASEHARIAGARPTEITELGKTAAGSPLSDRLPKTDSGLNGPNQVYLSVLFYEYANAKVEKDTARQAMFETQVRKYSTADTLGWLTCVTNYIYYLAQTGGRLYNSWTNTPQKLQFSVIDYQLPNTAVVAVIGDWGTGQDDSVQLLKTILRQHQPDAIIHLGDIYYSGTPIGTPSAPDYRGECQTNFLDVFTAVFDDVLGQGKRIPVFTIPGNHEYYSLGTGYYQEVLPQVNVGLSNANQPASYFCLRTQDGSWQFLGMDTGYNDSDPANQFNTFDPAPKLQDDEVIWHQDKLANFSGKTILLSHHQLYSANAKLNGSGTGYPVNLNPFLQTYFPPYFSKIAAWLWGHEHNMVLYKNGLLGLPAGRLIGASAYEETTAENPYAVNYPNIPYLDPTQYQLGSDSGYYNHGYAVISFARAAPSDPISISYYQYPSWGGVISNPPTQANLIYTEPLNTVVPSIGNPINYGESLVMQLPGYGNLAPIDPNTTIEYYPMIDPVSSVIVSFLGNAGQLTDGSTVQIQTTESSVGEYNLLGAWATKALYYYKPGYTQQLWTIKKADTSVDAIIHYGDPFYLVNQYYTDQWLTPLQESGATYLTTKASAGSYWTCQPIASGAPVSYNQNVQLQTQLSQWYSVGPEVEGAEYYPVLVTGAGISLQFQGGTGLLTHGAAVQIQTQETAVGAYNLLGAFSRRDCYWYKSGYKNQNWQIWKKDLSVDNVIRKGDLIYITNSYYAGQWLAPDPDGGTYYITTTSTVGSNYWRIA